MPADGLADALPIAPTAERAFAPSDRVSGFVRLYQQTSGRPVAATLTVAVLDARDRVLTEHTTAFDANGSSRARSADYHFDLPLNVAPGDYLLRLEATASNATATRGVRFSVR